MNENKNNDSFEIALTKKQVLILIGVLLVLVLGVTYAYFADSLGGSAETPIGAESKVSRKQVFDKGDDLVILATQENFGQGDGSLSDSTTSSARLIADTDEGTYSSSYAVEFEIKLNEYTYTVDENTPEMLLKIKGPKFDENGDVVKDDAGNIILEEKTTIDGLNYKTVNTLLKDPADTDGTDGWDTVSTEISGFDITNKTGVFTIAFEEITADSENWTIHDWRAEVTFINLDTKQAANEGKSLEAEFILRNPDFNEVILEYNKGIESIEAKTRPNFSIVSNSNDGLFAEVDDYGTSYYFRGAVDNNWVNFAGYYWRIIRINGDKSVRLIYSGTTAPDETQKVYIPTGVNIGTSAYALSNSSSEQFGYMYTLGQKYGTTTNSVIKTYIDNWYNNNLTTYTSYLSDTLFCNDLTTVSGTGIGSTATIFSGNSRIYSGSSPILTCQETQNAYTVNDIVNGNAALEYPVGILTADEGVFAGLKFGTDNTSNYLNSSEKTWLFGAAKMEYGSGKNFYLNETQIGWQLLNNNVQVGVRPVINVKSDVKVTGTGVWNDPYVVQTN